MRAIAYQTGNFRTSLITLTVCFVLTHFVTRLLRAQDSLVEKSNLAKQALLDGKYSDAVRLYRELLKGDSGDPGLHMNLAIALDKSGQPLAAIPEVEFVTRTHPSYPPAWFLLGLAYQQLNQPQKAIAPLRQALRLDPKNGNALLELADAELTSGDPLHSVKDFGALTATHPDFPKAWEGLGRAYLSLSEASFQQLQSEAPDSAFAFALMARARAREGRHAEALSLYATALTKAPDLPGLHAARADIYLETKHADWAAIEKDRESHLLKPDCSRRPTACAYLSADWDRTVAAARSASPEDLYWSSLASSHLAEKSFNKLAAFPQSPELHAVLADSYQQTGRRMDAVAEWRKAVELNPSDPLPQGRLAESLFRARQYPEAERILTALVARQPENGEWQYLLGNILLQLKRDEESLPHLISATNLTPNLLPAQEALGRLYLDMDKPKDAVVHLEKARSLDDGSISFALSAAYRKLGRPEEAHAALLRYRSLSKQLSPDATNDGAIPPP